MMPLFICKTKKKIIYWRQSKISWKNKLFLKQNSCSALTSNNKHPEYYMHENIFGKDGLNA